MLMLRVRQDQFSPFQIKNTTVELNPAMPDADKQLEVATLKAFASAFGLDPNQDAESLRAQFAQMMKDGKQFKLKASDKVNEKGVFTSLKVPQGGFTDRVVNPLAGLGITVVPSNNTRLPLPLLIVWRDETGADAGGISMIFGVTNAGQVVAQCNMDKAFINRARSAFTGCVSMVIGYMAMRNTTFTNDKNNPTIPVGSLSEAYRSSYIDIFGSAMWGPKSKSPFK